MITMNLKTKNYEIKTIKKSSKTASLIVIPKKYNGKTITLIPIIGLMETKRIDGETTINIESNYIKEVELNNKNEPNKIYMPKKYEKTECLIVEVID